MANATIDKLLADVKRWPAERQTPQQLMQEAITRYQRFLLGHRRTEVIEDRAWQGRGNYLTYSDAERVLNRQLVNLGLETAIDSYFTNDHHSSGEGIPANQGELYVILKQSLYEFHKQIRPLTIQGLKTEIEALLATLNEKFIESANHSYQALAIKRKKEDMPL